MKLRESELRQIIREEFMRGLPEWVLRQATARYVDDIRQQIKRFVMTNKSETPGDQREALAAANDVLEQLEEEAFDLVADKLYQFSRRV